jgi:ABC-type transport system substrate-binding protein
MACGAPQGRGAIERDGGEEAKPTGTKRITAAMRGNPASLSTKFNTEGTVVPGVDMVEQLVNAGLSRQDNRGALLAQLAEEVPSLENGRWALRPDGGMATTWKIREGVRWHDGPPLTSADLLFTVVVGQNRELPVQREAFHDLIEQVEAPDARTLAVHWKKPYIDADRVFGPGYALPLPKHVLEKPYAEDKASFLELPYWHAEIIGTGPYKLREFVRDSHLALVANDTYALGRPKIDVITEKAMLSVADYWQRLGVGVEPVVIPPQLGRDRQYMATFPSFALFNQPTELNDLQRLRGSEAALPETQFVGRSWGRYVNAEFDALIERFFSTIPRQARTEVLGEIMRHMSEQLNAMGLFYNAQANMIGNGLRRVTGDGTNQVWNAHEWDLE